MAIRRIYGVGFLQKSVKNNRLRILQYFKCLYINNKNNNIHKFEVQDVRRILKSCKYYNGRPGIDYRVASLFTRYLTPIGIMPENLKSITILTF